MGRDEANRTPRALPPQRDLRDIAGTWRDDPETERALDEQRAIDSERQALKSRSRDKKASPGPSYPGGCYPPDVDLEEANRILLAQVEELSGDKHVRREAAPWINKTPEQRLTATFGLAGVALFQLESMPDEQRARAAIPDPLPKDSLEILRRLGDGER